MGAALTFVPPYGPDVNPIERASSKLKAHLRKATERTIHRLWNAIGRVVDFDLPQDALTTSLPLAIMKNDRKPLYRTNVTKLYAGRFPSAA